MKKVLLSLISIFLLTACSNETKEQPQEPKLKIGTSLLHEKFHNQHDKEQQITSKTSYIIFSFSKESGHICNSFLQSKDANFLQAHHALYIADISPAPSLIKSFFIIPDLQKLPFTILLINDEQQSQSFSQGVDTSKIVVATLQNGTIQKITYLQTKEDLENFFSKLK